MKNIRGNYHFLMAISVTVACILFSTGTHGQSRYIPDSLKYLGRTPPGNIPERFPPDSLLASSDWFWHGPVTFSPDLGEMYWCKLILSNPKGKIFYMNYDNGQWCGPNQTNFTIDNKSYNNPFFTDSNDTLFYQSFRPGGFIYYVTRDSNSWINPVPMLLPVPSGKSPGLQFSLDQHHNVYAELDESATNIDIYKWKCINGNYTSPEKLDTVINSFYVDFCPYIDPDEHFIVFSSNRPGGFGSFDLYLSNRNTDGTWSVPVNLGSAINTSTDEWAPSITPDGLYLFFLSQRAEDQGYNPYWVSADVIYQLVGVNNQDRANNNLPVYLCQNSPNPFTATTSIKYFLSCGGFVSLEITNGIGVPMATLVNEYKLAGNHEIFFDAAEMTGGIYFYSLRVNNASVTRKMILIK